MKLYTSVDKTFSASFVDIFFVIFFFLAKKATKSVEVVSYNFLASKILIVG